VRCKLGEVETSKDIRMGIRRYLTYLLGFECQFDEDLLKLLIYVIDAKLLESILLEDFEPINV
jgi:hypothetical protein